MHRFFALLFVFAAAACGGGGASSEDTPTSTPAGGSNKLQEVAGARTETPASPSATATPPSTYEVVDGDTLSAIAERFGTTVDALVAANGLASPDELAIGQVLKIGTPGPAMTPAATATR